MRPHFFSALVGRDQIQGVPQRRENKNKNSLSFVFHKPGVLIAKIKGHLASLSMWCWCDSFFFLKHIFFFLSINCGFVSDGERCLLPYTLWSQTQHKDGLHSFVPEEEDNMSRQPRFTSVREKATTRSKCTLQTGRADTAGRRGPRSASSCLNHLITGVWEWQPEQTNIHFPGFL